MTVRPDVAAWFGDFAADLTDEQAEQLADLFDAVGGRWPDDDQADTCREVLIGGTQIVLGDNTLKAIAAEWHRAKLAEREAMARLTGALMASDGPERDLAERASVARMTVRKALGK